MGRLRLWWRSVLVSVWQAIGRMAIRQSMIHVGRLLELLAVRRRGGRVWPWLRGRRGSALLMRRVVGV